MLIKVSKQYLGQSIGLAENTEVSYKPDLLFERDTSELVRAYHMIVSASVRKRVLDLTKILAKENNSK